MKRGTIWLSANYILIKLLLRKLNTIMKQLALKNKNCLFVAFAIFCHCVNYLHWPISSICSNWENMCTVNSYEPRQVCSSTLMRNFFFLIQHYQEMEKNFLVSKHIGRKIFEHVDGR